MTYLLCGLLDPIWGFFKIMGGLILEVIIVLIFGTLYLLFMGISLVGNFAEIVFKKLAGIDTIYLNGTAFDGASGNGQDLVFAFITEPSVQNVFISILALSFVLLFIFTIVAMIKSEFALDLKGSAKSPIIGRALKSLVNFIVVPVTALISVIGVNYLTKTIYDMFGGSESTIASKCFYIGAYEANRVRNDDEFYEYLTSGECISGNNPFAGSSRDEIADKIDQAFMKQQEMSIEFNKKSFWDKICDAGSGDAYVEYQTLILGYPNISGKGYISYLNLIHVNYFYNLLKFDYVLGMGTAIVMAWTLLSVCLVLVKRVFELTILFLLAPAMTSIAPLDGGQAEKKWRQEFMKRLLGVIAPVFAFNMYFLLIPLFEGISLFGATTVAWISDWTLIFNIFFELVCILTGLSVVKSASALLSNLLGIEDLVKSGGEAAKKAVDLGKKAALGATAMGGVAVKGVAAVAKGARNVGSRVANSRAVGAAKSGLSKAGKKISNFVDEKAEKGNLLARGAKASGKFVGNIGKGIGHGATAVGKFGRKVSEGAKSGAKAIGGGIKKGAQFLGLTHEDTTEEIKGYDKQLNDEVDDNGNLIAGKEGLNTQVKQAEDAMTAAREAYDKEGTKANRDAYEAARSAYNSKKSERDSIVKKRADAVTRGQSAFGSAYEEEFGENANQTGFMAKLATGYNNKIKNSKLAKVPFLGERLKKTANSFQELFAIDGGTAARRLNDALAGLFGDGGGGDLWKINFNKNARAGLYEGVPESKKRESGIQQGLLMGAREKYEQEEKAKQERKQVEKELRRMIARNNGMDEYLKTVKEREKEGLSGTEIKKLDAKIEKMEVSSGLASRASRYYDDMSSGDSSKLAKYKDFKKELDNKAADDELKSEQKTKEELKARREKLGLSTDDGNDISEKSIAAMAEQFARQFNNALGAGGGIKLKEGQKVEAKITESVKMKIPEEFMEAITSGNDSVAKALEALTEAVNNLSGKKPS